MDNVTKESLEKADKQYKELMEKAITESFWRGYEIAMK